MSLVLKHEDIVKQDNKDQDGSSSRSNVWTWDTCVFTLINPSGEKV